MKYMILVDGMLHGYNRLDLLKAHILQNKPADYKVFQNTGGFTESYDEITPQQMDELLEVFYKGA